MRIKKYEFPIKVGGSEFTHYATFLGERMEYSQWFLDQVGEKEALRRFRKMTIKGLPQRLIPRWIKRIFIRRTMKKVYKLLKAKPDTQFPWIPAQIADEIVDKMKSEPMRIETKASAVKELRENPDKYKTAIREKQMKIYEVEQGDYGSYEAGYTIYFDSKQKAVDYCRENGFYRKDGEMLTSPLSGKTMLKVGDFLIDVTKKWMNDESFNDEDIWQIMCDFMTISEVTVH